MHKIYKERTRLISLTPRSTLTYYLLYSILLYSSLLYSSLFFSIGVTLALQHRYTLRYKSVTLIKKRAEAEKTAFFCFLYPLTHLCFFNSGKKEKTRSIFITFSTLSAKVSAIYKKFINKFSKMS
jgi:hypothetical protein